MLSNLNDRIQEYLQVQPKQENEKKQQDSTRQAFYGIPKFYSEGKIGVQVILLNKINQFRQKCLQFLNKEKIKLKNKTKKIPHTKITYENKDFQIIKDIKQMRNLFYQYATFIWLGQTVQDYQIIEKEEQFGIKIKHCKTLQDLKNLIKNNKQNLIAENGQHLRYVVISDGQNLKKDLENIPEVSQVIQTNNLEKFQKIIQENGEYKKIKHFMQVQFPVSSEYIQRRNCNLFFFYQTFDREEAIERFCKLSELIYPQFSTDIQKFKNDYPSKEIDPEKIEQNEKTIIQFYTDQSFCFRLLNTLIRATCDCTQLIYLLPFYRDFYNIVQRRFQTQIAKENKPFYLYRITNFDETYFQQLKQGNFLELFAFLSTSRDLQEIKKRFAGNTLQIFQIDPSQIKQPFKEPGFADISDKSTNKKQKQCIINPGNFFKIVELIQNPDGDFTYVIKLKYYPNEMMKKPDGKQNFTELNIAQKQQMKMLFSLQDQSPQKNAYYNQYMQFSAKLLKQERNEQRNQLFLECLDYLLRYQTFFGDAFNIKETLFFLITKEAELKRLKSQDKQFKQYCSYIENLFGIPRDKMPKPENKQIQNLFKLLTEHKPSQQHFLYAYMKYCGQKYKKICNQLLQMSHQQVQTIVFLFSIMLLHFIPQIQAQTSEIIWKNFESLSNILNWMENEGFLSRYANQLRNIFSQIQSALKMKKLEQKADLLVCILPKLQILKGSVSLKPLMPLLEKDLLDAIIKLYINAELYIQVYHYAKIFVSSVQVSGVVTFMGKQLEKLENQKGLTAYKTKLPLIYQQARKIPNKEKKKEILKIADHSLDRINVIKELKNDFKIEEDFQ